ncbi:hypothetical protein Goklo_016207 [Gossypium klotzschianum]|uniref:Uncharacterized protein n=1 Tax=Gossypium klotzschianum TaxID=34286 RepID=A0A7J8UDI3_9ROSI|nr:hypothetical protein [Gossypium klotzschianum]
MLLSLLPIEWLCCILFYKEGRFHQPLDLRGNGQVHTESKLKHVLPYLITDLCHHADICIPPIEPFMRPTRSMIEENLYKLNGRPTPEPLLDMFEIFPPLDEDGPNNEDDDDDNKEEIPIVPPDYERVFHPDRSLMKGVMIRNPSHHRPT